MGIFRYYNQNRFMFWTIIVTIIVFLFIIHIINSIVATNNKKANNNIIDERLYENKIDIEEQISDKQVEEKEELVIDQFIKYCNAKNTQSAYNLLSDECKKEVFPSLEIFETQYLNLNFNMQKLYSKKKYFGNTYEILLYENMLVTGSNNNDLNQDYYTIVKQDGKTKLNISNYIKREEINKTTKYKQLQIEATKKDIYKEYEIYELKVTNLNEDIIILDTKETTKTMYLLDENDVQYYSTSHEILDNNLKIQPMATNIIKIKYTKEYRTSSAEKLVFEDIILNYIENTKMNEYDKIKLEVTV